MDGKECASDICATDKEKLIEDGTCEICDNNKYATSDKRSCEYSKE